MRPKKVPGVIPEWSNDFLELPYAERERIARAMGITERTAHNWAMGKTVPSKHSAAEVVRRMKRGTK